MAKKQAAAQQPLLEPDFAEATIDGIVVEVLDPAKPIVAYNSIRAAIADLTAKYGKVVFDVSTTKGLDDAKAARAEIRDPRYKVEHIRKALKRPALDYSERIDKEAADYKASFMALEKPIDDQITAREQQIEQEKIAKAQREAEERRRVDQAIADLQFYAVEAAGKTIEQTRALLDELAGKALSSDEFGERLPEAVLARNSTVKRLEGMIDAAVAAAAEAQRLADEAERQRQAREELERQQRELERQRQELAAQQAAAAPPATFEENLEKANRLSAPVFARAYDAAHGVEIGSPGSMSEAIPMPGAAQELDDSKPFGGAPGDIDDSNPFGEPATENHDVDAMRATIVGVLDATDDEAERPTLAELVEVIADEFDVDDETAERWLRVAVAEA